MPRAHRLDARLQRRSHRPGTGVDPALLDAIDTWYVDDRFGDIERACLAFTEQHVIDVASLPDEVAGAVRAHLGDEGLSNFVSALLVVEQRIRLRLAWDRLLGDRPVDIAPGDH